MASFTSIPTELRLQIYENLALREVEHLVCIPEGKWQHRWGKKDGLSAQKALHLDWLSLSFTCKTIRAEIEDILSAKSEDNRTYRLDLLAERDTLRRSVWRSLPCHPNSVDHLVVDCVVSSGIWGCRRIFRGCGGFAAVIDDLYHTLNRLIHFGPQVASTTPLTKPMHIKNVLMRLRAGDATDVANNEQAHGKLVRVAGQFRSFALDMVESGMVFGFVDEFQFQVGDELTAPVKVVDCGNKSIPKIWSDYGFDWGAGATY